MMFRILGFLAVSVCISATLAEPQGIRQEIAEDIHVSANEDEGVEQVSLLQKLETSDDSREESSLEAADDLHEEEHVDEQDSEEMKALEQEEEEEEDSEEEEEEDVLEEEDNEEENEEHAEPAKAESEEEKAEKGYEEDVTSALQTQVVLADVHEHHAAEEYLQANKTAALLQQGEEEQASEDLVEDMEQEVGQEDEEGEEGGDWTEAMMHDVDEIEEDQMEPTMPLNPREGHLRPDDDVTSALQASVHLHVQEDDNEAHGRTVEGSHTDEIVNEDDESIDSISEGVKQVSLLQELENSDDSREESSLEAADDLHEEEHVDEQDLKEMKALEQEEEEEEDSEDEEEDVLEEEEDDEEENEEHAELAKAESEEEKAENGYEE